MSIFLMVLILIVGSLLILTILLVRKSRRDRRALHFFRPKNRRRKRVQKTKSRILSCPECGSVVHSRDLFCGECGVELSEEPAAADFIGSRWQLKENSTVVTFLEGGYAMFVFAKGNLGSWERSGKWKIKGGRLQFNCSDLLFYDVEIRDDRMIGSCRQISSVDGEGRNDIELLRISTDVS